MVRSASLPKRRSERPAAPAPAGDGCPWTTVDADGAGLALEDFPTFRITRLMHALQRDVTRPYLDRHALTVPDWRVLSFVLAEGPVAFGELARRSSLDKAQVSRTVRGLRERGLIVAATDTAHAQRLTLSITAAGRRLHARVLPEAARAQAALLRVLEPDDRAALWRALSRLQQALDDPPDVAGIAATPGAARTSGEP